jgi:hypothetical protein
MEIDLALMAYASIHTKFLTTTYNTIVFLINKSLQDLTVLPTEFFRRCKTHIPSVIILPTESQTEMIRR